MQWKKEWTVPSVVGAVSFAVGVGVGYGIRQYLNYREAMDIREVAEWVEEDEDEDVRFVPLSERYPEHFIEDEVEPEFNPSDLMVPNTMVHVFPDVEDEDGDWDYAEEMKTRTPDAPYIIHRNEFDDNENDWPHITLTYYRADDILCDTDDTPIYNAEKVASPLTFGKGSRDPSIVYIRNESLEIEYEVILDTGYYAREVLGADIEHSYDNEKPSLHKFKED